MPTWPAFSSEGVPGPEAGRESAPSVALNILLLKKENKRKICLKKKTENFKLWTKKSAKLLKSHDFASN